MTNPLAELLNRIKHDPALHQSLCRVYYRDFEGKAGIMSVPLIACVVESKNIKHGDTIIPFHRITSVTYETWTLYPFPDKESFEKILAAIKNSGSGK